VLNACARSEVEHVIAVTTSALYGSWPDNPALITEERELRELPRCPFINEKIAAEKQLQRFQRRHTARIVTVLRPAAVLGPNVRTYVTRFLTQRYVPVLAGFEPCVQALHGDDLSAAVLLAVQHRPNGVFNLAAPGVMALSSAVRAAGGKPLALPYALMRQAAALSWRWRTLIAPPELLDYLRYPCMVSTEKAHNVLGFSPRHDVRATFESQAGGAAYEQGGPS
jgi:UDP-glucose 4-epimerase